MNTSTQRTREGILGLGGEIDGAADDEHVQHEQQQQAEEAELLADDGEDEVGGALGEEFELCLAAVHPALAEHAAGADRDLRLDDVVAGAEWIGLRVEKHEHAL